MKYHATERMRQSVNDAMDVHAGRGVIDGPRNYLGSLYRAVPIAITVEGANILTRNLIIFGQGAIRAHPYLMPEMLALGNPDEERGMEVFHDVFWRHLRHVGMTSLRAIGRAWTGGMLAPTPTSGPTARHYRRLGRYAAGFALLADASLASLGGALAPRAALRKIGRHSVRAVSVVGRAQALGRRRPQARRPAAGALVHGAGRGSHRGRHGPGAVQPAGPGAGLGPARRHPAAAARQGAGRRLDARMRRAVAQALAHA